MIEEEEDCTKFPCLYMKKNDEKYQPCELYLCDKREECLLCKSILDTGGYFSLDDFLKLNESSSTINTFSEKYEFLFEEEILPCLYRQIFYSSLSLCSFSFAGISKIPRVNCWLSSLDKKASSFDCIASLKSKLKESTSTFPCAVKNIGGAILNNKAFSLSLLAGTVSAGLLAKNILQKKNNDSIQ